MSAPASRPLMMLLTLGRRKALSRPNRHSCPRRSSQWATEAPGLFLIWHICKGFVGMNEYLIGGSLKRRARWRCRSCRGREETTDGQINRHPRGRGAPGGSLLLRGGGGGGSPSAAPVTCRIWHGRRARESPPSGSCGGRLRGQRRRGRNSDRSAASGATRCGAATAAAVKPSSAPGKRLQKEVQQL